MRNRRIRRGAAPAVSCCCDGLERLEYRGYDSAGLSLVNDGAHRLRARGGQPRPPARGRRARATSRAARQTATAGIGHTRWATHGARDRGQRPPPLRHARSACTSCSTGSSRTTPSCARSLSGRGRAFTLRDRRRGRGPPHRPPPTTATSCEAVRRAYGELRGHYSFVAASADHPDLLVGARKECPLVVGRGRRASTSWPPPCPPSSPRRSWVQGVEDGEIVALTPDGA